MNISFVWIGGNVPSSFIKNYKTTVNLNSHHSVRLFQDADIEHLAKLYNILGIYQKLNLVNRVNLAKYLVLHYYPGVYSDIDIRWKVGVDGLLNDLPTTFYNKAYWPNHFMSDNNPEWISCVRPYIWDKEEEYCYTFDDHLVYAGDGASKKLIDFCLSRLASRDFFSNFFFEPFGPISITKLIYNKGLRARGWNDKQVQANGIYCIHDSTRLWDPTKIL
jgi:hypothetical protein